MIVTAAAVSSLRYVAPLLTISLLSHLDLTDLPSDIPKHRFATSPLCSAYIARYAASLNISRAFFITYSPIFRSHPYFAASLRNIFLHGPSLYNVRRNLYKRPSLRNISLHGSSLYNARPRYLDKRPSN